jgi:hypothetical protein
MGSALKMDQAEIFSSPRDTFTSGESAHPWAEAFGHPGHALTLTFGKGCPSRPKIFLEILSKIFRARGLRSPKFALKDAGPRRARRPKPWKAVRRWGCDPRCLNIFENVLDEGGAVIDKPRVDLNEFGAAR